MLMRHAKSDWADAGLSDHDRPLNARGKRDAPEMAKWIVENGGIPSLILASTAKRAAETVERLVKQWKTEPTILQSHSLYMASPHTILEHIRCEAIESDGKRPKTLLVVGHNPGMEQLVASLSGSDARMPTAAVAIFECSPIIPEDDEAPKIIRMLALGRPKEI